MKKVLRALLSFALMLTLVGATFALDETVPPMWADWGYDSKEAFMADYELTEADYQRWLEMEHADRQMRWGYAADYLERHPDAAEQFDAEQYCQKYYEMDRAKAAETWGTTLEKLDEALLMDWADEQYWNEIEYLELEELKARYPEECAAFDPYAYYSEHDPYGPTAEQYMADYGMTEQEFEARMMYHMLWTLDYRVQHQKDLDAFIAEHAEEYATFDANAYFYVTYGDLDLGGPFESPEAYKEYLEYDEEDFELDMLEMWMYDLQSASAYATYSEMRKTETGAYADGINVMVNGQCLRFDDVRPEVIDGRTMVPMRSVLEYLGATVAYQEDADNTVVVTFGGVVMTHVIGTDLIAVNDGQEEQTIQMDVVSYIKNDRTMVPLRFFAETMNCRVGWDSHFQTAVLINLNGLAETTDSELTIINRVLRELGAMPAEGKTMKTVTTIGGKLVLTDRIAQDFGVPGLELAGEYTYKFSGEALQNEAAFNGKYKLDIADFMNLVMGAQLYSEGKVTFKINDIENQTDEIKALYEQLKNLELNMIVDFEKDDMYFSGNALELMMTYVNKYAMEATDWDGTGWVKIPAELNMTDFSEMIDLVTDATLGDLLLVTMTDLEPHFDSWQNYESMLAEITYYLGDANFKEERGAYVLTYQESSYYSDVDLTLRVTPVGEGCTVDFTLFATLDEMASISVTAKGNGDKMTGNITVDVPEYASFTMDITETKTETTKTVKAEPDRSATIVNVEDL